MDTSSINSSHWHIWLEANAGRYLLFARSQTRCEADAQDLLQEVFVEVWRRSAGRPPDEALVYQTIRRRAVDLGRRIDRRVRREAVTDDWWQPPDSGDAGCDAELANAVKALPAHLREVVVLKIWSGLTFLQIAEALSLLPATAASRYRYAIEHLREALKEVRA